MSVFRLLKTNVHKVAQCTKKQGFYYRAILRNEKIFNLVELRKRCGY